LPDYEEKWVDIDDQLTAYRNVSNCIFFGFDHASDKGGLKDFHLVDEDLLWESVLNSSFELWVNQIEEVLHDSNEGAKSSLIAFIEAIHKTNARSLVRLSRFFKSVIGQNPSDLREFVRICQLRLPEWGGLPLANLPIGRNIPRAKKLIEFSQRFASHAIFSSFKDRNVALKKIDSENRPLDTLPDPVIDGDQPYRHLNEYLEDVKKYISENNLDALSKLRKLDAYPLLTLLEKSTPRKGNLSAIKIKKLKGYSDAIFLQAIFSSMQEFIKEFGSDANLKALNKVHIVPTKFISDGEEPENEIARLIGGISENVIPKEISLNIDDELHSFYIEFGGLDDLVIMNNMRTTQLNFKVEISSTLDIEPFETEFAWELPATHPERLRIELAKKTITALDNLNAPKLPSFNIGGFDELFFAADEDDVNRLLLLGINEFNVKNSLSGLVTNVVDQQLQLKCTQLTNEYKNLLEAVLNHGFYKGNLNITKVISHYEDLVSQLIGQEIIGAEQLLPRFYRGFLATRSNDSPSSQFLSAAIVLPISPFVLELSLARAVFLREGFSEVIFELFSNGQLLAQQRWERLLGLAELRRPLVCLICDANKSLSTRTRAFGLTHLHGNPDDKQLSVTSQSLMREQTFEEDDLTERLRPSAAARIYERLIDDYLKLHPHANDQISILATNVLEVEVLLSGIDRWLKRYLKSSCRLLSPLVLNVKVITTGVAATTASNILTAWRSQWSEGEFIGIRRCIINIGHRHSQTPDELNKLLIEEENLRYDIGIISHFLEGQHDGDQLKRAPSFNHIQGDNFRQFPIAEYPRPSMQADAATQRKTLISNRRIRLASKHTELAARLKVIDTPIGQEHVVLSQVDFTPWQKTLSLLHQKTLWVGCVDRYVDRNLLSFVNEGNANNNRRVVGFSCGLGDYGELNLTVSTEVNDLVSLTNTIANKLRGFLKGMTSEQSELASRNVVDSAAEIPGLSLVRAAGHDEYIRDVLGCSLVRRLLGRDENSLLNVLIPLDSFRHWFYDREDSNIPDMLFLSATIHDGLINIKAVVIESKFAIENSDHTEKAFAQASSGLKQLSRIFSPHGVNNKEIAFERKYWWAQLHRALSSRAVVTLPLSQYEELCAALERLGEGFFSISWQSIACTFWVNKTEVDRDSKFMGSVDLGIGVPLPQNFGVYQLQFGSDDIKSILTNNSGSSFNIPGEALVLSSSKIQHPERLKVEQRPIEEDVEVQHPDVPFENQVLVNENTTNEIDYKDKQVANDDTPEDLRGEHNNTPKTNNTPPLIETSNLVSRILLGTDSRNQNIFWEYGDNQLENRHLLIFGGSGSGKTYAIQCLLLEMAKLGQHSAIIDYTDGFLPSHLENTFIEFVQPETHVLFRQPFPINPFQPLSKEEPGLGVFEEQPQDVASRISDIFSSVYDVGDVQRGKLVGYIESGLTDNAQFTLDDLLVLLEGDPTATNLAIKIREFVKKRPFAQDSDSGWGDIFKSQKLVQILQLTNLSKDIQRLITEFALWDFFAYAARHGNKNKPLPVVLDEVQNLDHRSDRAIDKLLREGRKFGVGLILATQTISNFDKEQRSRLFQAGHKLFFKPAETERKEFAQILSDVSPSKSKDEWISELSKLGKGECWSIGPRRIGEADLIKRDPVKVKVSSIDVRLKI